MPAFKTSAPGKVILFGEHAVVYGQPALAVPLDQLHASVVILAAPRGETWIEAPGIGLSSPLDRLPVDHPLRQAILETGSRLGLRALPAFRLKITSTIPIASGLGSGAAVSVAIARAVSAFVGRPLPDEEISNIAYRVDQTYHGSPSGIDNTVIAYAQPIWFVRGQPFERLACPTPFTILVADTGLASSTAEVVGDVRRRWLANPAPYEAIFTQIGALARQARDLIVSGNPKQMGGVMLENHELLRQLDVSSPELDRLVAAAMQAGALGAKLCGAGRGGNMIALTAAEDAAAVAAALREAGARQTLRSQVK